MLWYLTRNKRNVWTSVNRYGKLYEDLTRALRTVKETELQYTKIHLLAVARAYTHTHTHTPLGLVTGHSVAWLQTVCSFINMFQIIIIIIIIIIIGGGGGYSSVNILRDLRFLWR
jgi:hypothetical protein